MTEKDKKTKIILCVLGVFLFALLTACGNAKSTIELKMTSDEVNDSEDTYEYSSDVNESGIKKRMSTYQTRLVESKNGKVPIFSFDYYNNWRVSNEGTGEESESVELTNENGIVIRYTYLAYSFAYGDPRYEIEVDISKLADSSFVPSYAQTTDYSNLGKFAVVKVESDSQIYYAVKPEYECGRNSIEGNFMTGFWYDGALEFMAEIPNGITETDEQEVIDILSSFRVSEVGSNNIEEDATTYTALQKGDFSEYAGTYRAMGVYEDWYGGGEPISDLFLDKDGIITGGGMTFYPEPYPNIKPVEITKNEDGSYKCQVRYEGEDNQDYFLIYPEGTIGENPYIYNDPFLTEHIYIQYMSIDGGVSDIIYYKVED